MKPIDLEEAARKVRWLATEAGVGARLVKNPVGNLAIFFDTRVVGYIDLGECPDLIGEDRVQMFDGKEEA